MQCVQQDIREETVPLIITRSKAVRLWCVPVLGWRRHLWNCGVRVVPDLCLKPSVTMPVEIHEGKSYGLERDAHEDSKWSRRYNSQHRLWGLTMAMGNALCPHLQ